jgi:serine/threonine-protein kinase RsbW
MTSSDDLGRQSAVDLAIPSDLTAARRVQDDIEQLLRTYQYTDRDIFCIRLALEEALVNAIKHGNQMDQTKTVRISYQIVSEVFEVRITDEGTGFDPSDVPDPTTAENLERPCGRGLMLMRHYMGEVSYNERGNSVWMRRQCNGAK